MKKSILTFLFITIVIFAHAQIRKNFGTELKALIDANESAVKGDLINKEESKVITMAYFKSKLSLTGFDSKFVTGGVSRSVWSTYNGKATLATMDDIAAKLAVLEKDYTILDSKTDNRLLATGKNDFTRKILLTDNVENIMAKIELYENNKISIDIEKGFRSKLSSQLQKNIAAVQIGEQFAVELMRLSNADIETIKGLEYDNGGFVNTYLSKLPLSGFKVKLKEVFDNYTVECEPDGIFSDATMDSIVAGDTPYLFTILDSKTQPNRFDLKSGSKPLVRRIILLDEITRNLVKADIQATEDYKEVYFTIYKYDKPLK